MPKNPGNDWIEFGMGDFRAALRQYAKERKDKDYHYIVNRSALNLAFKCAQATPLADKNKIRAIKEKSWWPKYVAKRLKSRHGVDVQIRANKKKGIKAHKQKLRFSDVRGKRRHYTVDQARDASKQLIENRVKRTGYLKSGWGKIIDRLKALKLASKAPPGALTGARKIRKKPGEATVARAVLNPTCSFFVGKHITRKMKEYLRRALPVAAADMREYVRQQMLKRAKKYAPESR